MSPSILLSELLDGYTEFMLYAQTSLQSTVTASCLQEIAHTKPDLHSNCVSPSQFPFRPAVWCSLGSPERSVHYCAAVHDNATCIMSCKSMVTKGNAAILLVKTEHAVQWCGKCQDVQINPGCCIMQPVFNKFVQQIYYLQNKKWANLQ